MNELLTTAEIIELRKQTYVGCDLAPWSTSIAFARAVERVVIERLNAQAIQPADLSQSAPHREAT